MTGRTRVAVVITRCIAGAGGVAVRGALALDPDLFEVTILTGTGDRLLEQAQDGGVEVVHLDHLRPQIAPRSDWAAWQELVGHLGGDRFDVVHTHSSKAGLVGRTAARWVRVPRIVHTFHGFPFHEFQSWARRSAYIQVERQLGRITDSALAVGTAVAAEAVRRRIAAPDRIRTIGVARDTTVPLPDGRSRAEARRLLGVPLGMHVIGTVGRLDYQKAPENLIRAFARIPRRDIFGVWIGSGPDRARSEELVRSCHLEGRFSFLGERSDVAKLLPGLDIFAMASRYEGLPCAVVEAMAIGLPVVATAVNAVPDVVIPGETGLLVPPEQPASLAAALSYLLANPQEAARLGAAGRAGLGSHLTPEALGRVLTHIYRSGSSQPPAPEVVDLRPLREVG